MHAFMPKRSAASDKSSFRNAHNELDRTPAFSSHPSAEAHKTIYRKSSCACGGGCPACQAKSSNLKVSQPNDSAEIEADQIADQVMRMPLGVREGKPIANIGGSPSTIHRKCAGCEDEERPIHRKPLPSGGGISTQSPAHVQHAIGSGGRPLDRDTRTFFEPRFGYDLSSVRVHTDSMVGQSARAIDARAYTLGSNIVFGNGEYRPDSESGRHLLAHELAHTVQQNDHISRREDEMDTGVLGGQDAGISGSYYDGDGPNVEMPVSPPSRREAGVDIEEDRGELSPVPMGPTAATAEITLETGNSGASSVNNLVHQQVCVDRPTRSKRCFSFAAVGVQAPQFSSTWLGWSSWVTGAILKGEVYDPAPVSGATIVSTHTPTVTQADNWVNYMDTSRLGLQDGYSVARHNCRTFSQWEFRDAPLHY